MAQPPDSFQAKATALKQYSACDIADALLGLKVAGAGFVADLNAYHSQPDAESAPKAIAPASTVLFAEKGVSLVSPTKNIPAGSHWADLTEPGSIVVLRQPDGQRNAVCGGIMALRMKVRRVEGIVAVGRVRDLDELRSTGLPLWARGVSAVGAGGGSVPWAVQVPIKVDGTVINPGDLVFCDPASGVVIIPQEKVDALLELLPKLTAADDRVKEAVLGGMSVYEAFKTHRSNL